MENDPEIENYVQKAEQLKSEEKTRSEKAKNKKRQIQMQIENENSRDKSFDFYQAMKPSRTGPIWFKLFLVFVLGSELVFFANLFADRFSFLYFITVGCGVACALRYLYSWFYTITTFSEFKVWQQQLPFRLTGWERLTQSKNGFDLYFWRVKCEIRILFKGNYTDHQKAIDAICYLFTVNANDEFYGLNGAAVAGYARDPRVKWTYSDGTFSGSSNIRVVGEIYHFIKDDLVLLARKYDIIESVEIIADQDEHSIRPRIRIHGY